MGRYSLHKKVEKAELGKNANCYTAMIFLADHDKFFLKFHVQLAPRQAAGKTTEATKFHVQGHL